MQNTLFETLAEITRPEPQTAGNLIFRNIDEIKAAISEIKQDGTTFERLKELQNYFIQNEEKTAAEIISRLTIKEINTFIYSRPGSNKAELVKSMTEAITQSFDICDGMLSYSWTWGDDKKNDPRKEAQKARFDSTTPEMYEAWKEARRQKAAAFKKAMENPETLQEFNTFVKRKGEAALTTEQREIYDELRTGITKEQKAAAAERKAQISAVALDNTEMLIIETVHTKKNIPLWVVRLSERVEKFIFQDLNSRAKQLGGYYSSYKGGGAIPGFTFERKEAAELFTQIKDGDINASELRKAINAERTQERAENLQAKAENINEKATEELNKDRKDNTHRRATMASHAEQRAAANIVFSITLNKIAEGIQAGTIKHLEKLTTISQLEELESILSAAKWRYIRDKNIKSEKFVFTPEVIDFAEYPHPVIYKEYIFSTLNKLQHDKGKKLAAARMAKRINRLKPETQFLTITEGQPLEDFKTLFLWTSPGIDKYECERYKNAHLKLERIKRLGITTIFELRAALRELVRIKEGVQLTDEQKKMQKIRELERQFVGKKIDGFFPTPPELAAEIVRKAGIVEGERILEPSAGLGHLAEAITEAHPDNELICIEYYEPLADALKLKGFECFNMDFLHLSEYSNFSKSKMFDKIIMNPPFENLQDIDHVLTAWDLLKSGGRIVAIMAGNKSRETGKVKDFMQFVDQYGTWEENPTGSFASAFRPTGVNTITVILDKP
jgi:phospholipid N-methyltransferase